MGKRLDRDTYFMQLACLTALRGTCPRAIVGCIIVTHDNRIVSTGYNSSYPGTPHCDSAGCLIHENHCVRCIHAEEAAILKLEKRYNNLKVYVTHEPCIHCYKSLCNSGVEEIYYLKPYRNASDNEAYKTLIKEIGVKPQPILSGECIIHQKF